MRWMWRVSLKDRKSLQELLDRLGNGGVADGVVRGRLRWFGHVERRSLRIGYQRVEMHWIGAYGGVAFWGTVQPVHARKHGR